MSVIITGSAGNLGRAVTSHLLDEGYSVWATVAQHEPLDFITHPNLHVSSVDLLKTDDTEAFVNGLDAWHGDQPEAAILLAGGFSDARC